MRKCFAKLIIMLLSCASLTLGAAALSPDEIISASAILMDADTGQILFDKNMSGRAYPASTTKIMTGLLVSELCDPQEIATVTQNAVDIDEWNSANIALTPGEDLSVDSALYALMLPSANDAANVLAEHAAGSQNAFVELMNQKAQEIGALDTHFANAHGLHEDDHYTTPYDMALITQYAVKNPLFRNYFSTGTVTIPATNLQPLERPFSNYCFFLVKGSRFYDPSVIAGKVGFTNEARHTMSTVASKYGRTFICVVMGSSNRDDKFTDTQALLNYGYESFRAIKLTAEAFAGTKIPIQDGEDVTGSVHFQSGQEFTALLHNDLNADDIRISYDEFPQVLGHTDPVPTSVNVRIDSDIPGLPSILGTQPLVSEIVYDQLALTSAHGPLDESEKSRPLIILIATLSVVAFLFLVRVCLVARRQHVIQKRRRERIERLNRRMRGSYSR